MRKKLKLRLARLKRKYGIFCEKRNQYFIHGTQLPAGSKTSFTKPCGKSRSYTIDVYTLDDVDLTVSLNGELHHTKGTVHKLYFFSETKGKLQVEIENTSSRDTVIEQVHFYVHFSNVTKQAYYSSLFAEGHLYSIVEHFENHDCNPH